MNAAGDFPTDAGAGRTGSTEKLPERRASRGKRGQQGMPVPRKPGLQVSNLLRGFGLEAVVGESEARFVTVAGVFVEHALGDGLVDGGHRGMEEIARGGGVASGYGSAQTAHQRADPGAVGAVHFGALTRLRRPLQNRLFLLLNFGSLSLGHLLLLLCTA